MTWLQLNLSSCGPFALLGSKQWHNVLLPSRTNPVRLYWGYTGPSVPFPSTCPARTQGGGLGSLCLGTRYVTALVRLASISTPCRALGSISAVVVLSPYSGRSSGMTCCYPRALIQFGCTGGYTGPSVPFPSTCPARTQGGGLGSLCLGTRYVTALVRLASISTPCRALGSISAVVVLSPYSGRSSGMTCCYPRALIQFGCTGGYTGPSVPFPSTCPARTQGGGLGSLCLGACYVTALVRLAFISTPCRALGSHCGSRLPSLGRLPRAYTVRVLCANLPTVLEAPSLKGGEPAFHK